MSATLIEALDRLSAALEQHGKPVPHDERGCDDETRISFQISDNEGPHPCRTVTEIQMNGTAFEPKAQEQGGDDCVNYRSEWYKALERENELRARLAACEKERDHYKDFCGSQRFASDYQNADQMREDINDLRRQLADAKASEAKMIDALATGKQIGLVTEEYAAVVKERDELRARLDDEKKRRVYYQGIVYDVMNSMSNGKMVCGTVDEPSTQVQDGVRLVLKHRNEFEQEAMNLRARLDNVEKENAELKRQKEAWRDEFIILNDVMRDVSACNAYDEDEISRIDKSEVKG